MMTTGLSQDDVRRVAAEMQRLNLASYTVDSPPGDLVYHQTGQCYHSPSTGLFYAKSARGRLRSLTQEEYLALVAS